MIVMKFGGSSLASASSIKRAAAVVQQQIHRSPLVVVSAFGDTTDHLLDILACASRANTYKGWKSQEELRNYHFCLAEDLLTAEQFRSIDGYLRQIFRDLHVRMLEVCEGERTVTPELRDWVVSLGEQLSSRIVAAAFQSLGIQAAHMDSRKLIVTDDRFTNAEPRYWETYANIRWAVPFTAKDRVVVVGGFIGAAEDGRTTTLGRGGSDLTASIFGAALNAEEIQFWKDVDGLLTWDPRIKSGAYRVECLSYPETADLARAGATILHPDSIAPAQRLRIPITIRNTFCPECEGTKIGAVQPGGIVKSIACRTNITLLELQSPTPNLDNLSLELEQFSRLQKLSATVLGASANTAYLAIEGNAQPPEQLDLSLKTCVEAHIRTRQAIITLVGAGITDSNIRRQIADVLAPSDVLLLPCAPGSCAIHIAVPQDSFLVSLDKLARNFFEQRAQSPAMAEIPTKSEALVPAGLPSRGGAHPRPLRLYSAPNANANSAAPAGMTTNC